MLSLAELDLASNFLVQIPQNAFLRFAHSLRKLNLEQNQFGQLPAALRPLVGLKQLNLAGNQLSGLDERLLKGLKATTHWLAYDRGAATVNGVRLRTAVGTAGSLRT